MSIWPRVAFLFLALTAVTRAASPVHSGAPAGTTEERIAALLVDFLTYNSDPARHDGFWADDVIYTSGVGAVRTKPMIMQSVREAAAKAGAPAATYTAEDVKVRVYATFAALTFELVSHLPDGSVRRARNSGALVERDGRWQVVMWQSTPIAASTAR